jgi:hypothetical protein
MLDTQRRFDEVLYMLEQERKRVDKNLRELTAAAAYLRALLPERRRSRPRMRCTPRRGVPGKRHYS